MRRTWVSGLMVVASLVFASAAVADHYAWPRVSGVVMTASTNSTTATCDRADRVLDSWLAGQPASARPAGYNSLTVCGAFRSSSSIEVVMRVFCSYHEYYCQAGGVWDCLVDWDRVDASRVNVRVLCTRR